jgi:hypothetical protein
MSSILECARRSGTLLETQVAVGTYFVRIEISAEESIGFDTLLTKPITKSSAMQRTGRAGREVCSLLSMQI